MARLLLWALVLAFACVPSLAWAHGGDTSLIHACVQQGSLQVRIVGANEACRGPETPVHWAAAGAQGPGLATGAVGGQVVGCTPNLFGTLVFIPGHSFVVITGGDGRFTMSHVPPGTYDIAIEEPGRAPFFVRGVVVTEGQTTDLAQVHTCVTTCSTGQTDCGGGVCANLTSDTANCGACGHACVAGLACVSSTCVTTCPTGTMNCGGACVNLATDTVNCGACGHACTAGQACVSSTCVTTCPTGMTNCGGVCVNIATDTANCGACGSACAFPNAIGACTAGRCTIAACLSSFADCDGNVANGCEINTQIDPHNCGVCGKACSVCILGTCF